jgi:D-alanyl-D-alanine carboxypeptidase/D-alanyl-D-alanine endopeptidase (penicillin-binding protein 7)
MFKKSLFALLISCVCSAYALPFSSQHALVFEEESGKVLLEKDATAIVPIASLTKLMTAMVVLDAMQDMEELISIEESDVDTLKHSSSRVPVGATLPRKAVLQLALMSSDNRAAAALARTYLGGKAAFLAAVQEKLRVLDMQNTVIEEPTGLSPRNRSTAEDVLKMVSAAAHYPEISQMTSEDGKLIDINGRQVEYRNTNHLVGKKGWDITLSKTGFTQEAGRCLIMRLQTAGKHVIVVLLNAKASAARVMDAENVQRYLNGQPAFFVKAASVRTAARKKRGKNRGHIVISSVRKGGAKAQKKGRTATAQAGNKRAAKNLAS